MDPEVEIDESPSSIEIESSTDTVEQVQEALGGEAEVEVSPEAAPAEAAKPGKAGQRQAAEAEEDESADEDEDDDEEEPHEEKPAKKAPTVVSRTRLNEVIAQRNRERTLREDAERRLSEATSRPAKGAAAEESVEPQTFSGEIEPRIEDYTDKPDKYPDPYAAFTKAHGAWVRKETLAEVEVNRANEAVNRQKQELTDKFNVTVKETLKRRPDYKEVIASSEAEISELMIHRIKKSSIGADLQLHFAENPDYAAEVSAMDAEDQIAEVAVLERTLKRAIKKAAAEAEADGADDEEEKPAPKAKATVPPKKPVSKAPPPPNRLKPSGQPPKTLDELAGPADKTGIDIEFNPEYERAVKAQRRS